MMLSFYLFIFYFIFILVLGVPPYIALAGLELPSARIKDF